MTCWLYLNALRAKKKPTNSTNRTWWIIWELHTYNIKSEDSAQALAFKREKPMKPEKMASLVYLKPTCHFWVKGDWVGIDFFVFCLVWEVYWKIWWYFRIDQWFSTGGPGSWWSVQSWLLSSTEEYGQDFYLREN